MILKTICLAFALSFALTAQGGRDRRRRSGGPKGPTTP